MQHATLEELVGERVEGWRVRDGRLILRTPGGEVACVCACGRAHLLPTEELEAHRLLLHCHGCGAHAELGLA